MSYMAYWTNGAYSSVDVVDDSTKQKVFTIVTTQPIFFASCPYDAPDTVVVTLQDGTVETWSITTRTRISSTRRG